MRQSIKHRLVEALRFIERTSDKVARRLEPGAYRVWSMRPPEGADPLAKTHITIKGRGNGTFFSSSGTIHRDAPLLE